MTFKIIVSALLGAICGSAVTYFMVKGKFSELIDAIDDFYADLSTSDDRPNSSVTERHAETTRPEAKANKENASIEEDEPESETGRSIKDAPQIQKLMRYIQEDIDE